mmetsp:Transcript_19447/g.45132  ORF Transcript_19447/g.45132 Transcript_19447/m.45132 type:complete len:337 (+) Transcript_19447:342-1352(+)
MDVDNDSSNAKGEAVGDDKKTKKKKMKEAKSRLKSKKEEKAELMKKVPLKDEEGIAYTKFQIRQMLKRVKKGLAPVATAKEIEEKRQNEARLRREEEAELAGLASTRNTVDNNKVDTNETKTEDDSDDDDDDDDEKGNENEVSNDDGGAICQRVDGPITGKDDGSAKKKVKRNKPVPSDYVCQACKNRHQPAHWIYDCPDKVTVRGTNKKRKKERGISDPDSKKVFVSGLPFDAKVKAVEDFFAVTKNCGTVAAVRLVKFEDTGRCNGQAYISFDTDDGAQRAIALSGTTIDAAVMSSSSDVKDSKKKKEDETPAKRKELKLKVSKVLNRRKTKRG